VLVGLRLERAVFEEARKSTVCTYTRVVLCELNPIANPGIRGEWPGVVPGKHAFTSSLACSTELAWEAW